MDFAAGLIIGFCIMLFIHRAAMADIERQLDEIIRGK